MQATIQQWGNSLALRIPKAFAQQTKVKKGSRVNLTLKNGRVIMEPIKRQKYTLQELVSRITSQNRHSETSWGMPQGKEVW
ncbi:MAG TPA: AbrB/MazE/SpoVT family DNA-binding domain-containing protein [Verrucomicrobiae bacterium]|nr:AbrB/MazE/SpoVT family DNA-binding domain-containing protein [Verrucomicrobiae bacterium]